MRAVDVTQNGSESTTLIVEHHGEGSMWTFTAEDIGSLIAMRIDPTGLRKTQLTHRVTDRKYPGQKG